MASAIARDRLILAMDVPSREEAEQLMDRVGDSVRFVKIGLELYAAAGPSIVEKALARGKRVFLDLKFHDIPRTVAKASVEATRLGVRMFDLHASGSFQMMRQTVLDVGRVCRSEGIQRPKMLAVTVLTSHNQQTLGELGVNRSVEAHVEALAALDVCLDHGRALIQRMGDQRSNPGSARAGCDVARAERSGHRRRARLRHPGSPRPL